MTPRDRGRAPPPARRAGGGWGKKAGVGPCDPEYALKLELLRKKAGVDAAFFELGHLAADSADTLAASVDAKAIGDAFEPGASRNALRATAAPRFAMATAVYFIPPVRCLLFRASAAFFRSANSLALCEWRVAISNLLFGRRLREGGGFSVASAMASCSAATQASLVFPFGSVPSKSGTPAMPNNRSPSLSTLLTHCTSCKYMSSSLSLTSRHVPSGRK